VLIHSQPQTREPPAAIAYPPPDAPGSGATGAVAAEIEGIAAESRASAAHFVCCVCGGWWLVGPCVQDQWAY
jgi:hypothetical protein